MPAIVYGKAFVVGQDTRLKSIVATIEAAHGPMVDVYVMSVHDVFFWCIRHLIGAALSTALASINAAYGSEYNSTTTPWRWLGPHSVFVPA